MRRLSRWIAAVAVPATVGAVPGIALADCTPSFVDGPMVVSLAANDSMDNGQLNENFKIRIRNDGNSQCQLRLTVSRDDGASDPGFPAYKLTGAGAAIQINPGSPADFSGSGQKVVVRPSGENPSTYTVHIPVGWGMKSGEYAQQLVFAITEDGSNTQLATQQVKLALRIPATSRLRFDGATGGGARIDLGTLRTEGPTISDPFGVRVLSTAGYQLRFSSGNGGKLRRVDGSDTIPYEMLVDGRLMNLLLGDQIIGADHTTSSGDLHPVVVTVRPDPTYHAGNYTDRITVSVTPI